MSYTIKEAERYREELHNLIYLSAEHNLDWLTDIEVVTGHEIEGLIYDEDTEQFRALDIAYKNGEELLAEEYAQIDEWISDYYHRESDYEDYCQRERWWDEE